jgi:hypothetical protein
MSNDSTRESVREFRNDADTRKFAVGLAQNLDVSPQEKVQAVHLTINNLSIEKGRSFSQREKDTLISLCMELGVPLPLSLMPTPPVAAAPPPSPPVSAVPLPINQPFAAKKASLRDLEIKQYLARFAAEFAALPIDDPKSYPFYKVAPDANGVIILYMCFRSGTYPVTGAVEELRGHSIRTSAHIDFEHIGARMPAVVKFEDGSSAFLRLNDINVVAVACSNSNKPLYVRTFVHDETMGSDNKNAYSYMKLENGVLSGADRDVYYKLRSAYLDAKRAGGGIPTIGGK